MDLALTCDGLPGPQVATCRSCDDDTGVLPLTCNLVFPSSKAGEPAEKVAPSNREKLVALSLVILLVILVFMLLKELRMSPRIPRSIWKGRGRHVGNPEVEDSKYKMRHNFICVWHSTLMTSIFIESHMLMMSATARDAANTT